jgi:hypothetical protein
VDLPTGKQDKDFWLNHLAALEKYEGSVSKYCRENRLSKSKLSYYRGKTKEKKSEFSEVRPVGRPVKIEKDLVFPVYNHRLPDPKWLSQLIRELCR